MLFELSTDGTSPVIVQPASRDINTHEISIVLKVGGKIPLPVFIQQLKDEQHLDIKRVYYYLGLEGAEYVGIVYRKRVKQLT